MGTGLLAQDWAKGDKAVLGFWIEHAYPDQTALAIWPIGPTMAARPERVLLESRGVNFWQTRHSPDHRWVSFVAQRMRNPATVEIGIVAESSDHAMTWSEASQPGGRFKSRIFSSPDWHIDPNIGRAEIGVASGKLVLPMQSVKGSIWLLSGVSPRTVPPVDVPRSCGA